MPTSNDLKYINKNIALSVANHKIGDRLNHEIQSFQNEFSSKLQKKSAAIDPLLSALPEKTRAIDAIDRHIYPSYAATGIFGLTTIALFMYNAYDPFNWGDKKTWRRPSLLISLSLTGIAFAYAYIATQIRTMRNKDFKATYGLYPTGARAIQKHVTDLRTLIDVQPAAKDSLWQEKLYMQLKNVQLAFRDYEIPNK